MRFEDRDVYQMTGSARARFRARNIGFVFQMFHLVPYLNVLENVLVAGAVAHRGGRERRVRKSCCNGSAWGTGSDTGPRSSSAGEKQRTAIARALLNRPKLILADEPTGNLDPENAQGVLQHLQGFQKAGGTVIVATHGLAAQGCATRTINLREGRLV